ncbi:unnamed protein product [Strongylus vulgaris]|uniref:Beta-lactamase-related domain-containing protein n=1 Tax=Strongylus vulgaris TaxID=40348 RepID=A0A3P7JI82_STRVU|nr:unnamed protein product [Strongylus vulgaris]
MSVAFSTTKAVAAVCIALLADRGRLRYDDLVSKHWPENITIEWVMSHKSGLYYFDTPVTEKAVRNHNLMRELIENETSKIPPGTGSGYHTFTYGWLVDQIVRHTDEKKRGIGQFLREEITQPNGNLTIKSPICISEMRKTLNFDMQTYEFISTTYNERIGQLDKGKGVPLRLDPQVVCWLIGKVFDKFSSPNH